MNEKSDKNLTKSKVLFLCRLFHPHIGGVEKHVAELSRELTRRGYSVTVITEQYVKSLSLFEKTNTYVVHRIPYEKLSTKLGIWGWILGRWQLFDRADIIHAHDVFWWYLPLRLFMPWKRVFTTFHGYEGSTAPTPKAIRSRRISEILSKGTMCIGEWMKKWYGAKPDFVSYGAASYKPSLKSSKPKDATAVFIGRLAADTGILEYIRGVKLLNGKISLDIYGEGELLSEVKNEVRGTGYIKYKGVTNFPEKTLKNYRFACVSRYLGMIEAMQLGRYVFAHWNNAIKRDYLDSFPAISQATTFTLPEEFAEEVGYVLSHPEKEDESIRRAQEWAREQKWSKITDLYEELWKK